MYDEAIDPDAVDLTEGSVNEAVRLDIFGDEHGRMAIGMAGAGVSGAAIRASRNTPRLSSLAEGRESLASRYGLSFGSRSSWDRSSRGDSARESDDGSPESTRLSPRLSQMSPRLSDMGIPPPPPGIPPPPGNWKETPGIPPPPSPICENSTENGS